MSTGPRNEKSVFDGDLLENGDRVEAHVYQRTRRYEVEAGTKCASALVNFATRNGSRVETEKRARELVEQKFFEVHGEIKWDSVDFTVVHTTFQVLIEMRQYA